MSRSFSHKLQDLENLSRLTRQLREQGQVLVLCHGVFDLMHPGHIQHLEAAKKRGNLLIVTITPDHFVVKGPGRPVFNQRLRAETVAALGCVDYVAINDWPTAVETIALLRPHVYCKGSDYEQKESDVTGAISLEEQAIKLVGGEMFLTREISFSSSELLNKFYSVYSEEARQFLESFKTRYSVEELLSLLQNLQKLKVLVIGEAIIDEYSYCVPMGKSPKEAIVSTRHAHTESFAGGALACANHVAGFCKEVHLLTCLGAVDSREDFIRSALNPAIVPRFLYRPNASTIVKRRYIWKPFLVKMFEVSTIDDSEQPPVVEREFLDGIANLSIYDLVIVADYGHGMINPRVAARLSEAKSFLAVNAQTNSANFGFNLITKYPRADYVCIDEPELRLAMSDRASLVPRLAGQLKETLKADFISVTRGHEGAFTRSATEQAEVPVFSSEVVDRVGAGDAFLSVTAPCAASRLPAEVVGFIGNAVGALAVRIVGNRTAVDPVHLYRFMTALMK